MKIHHKIGFHGVVCTQISLLLLVACMSNTAGFTLAPSSGFSQLSFESGSHAHMDNETVLVHTEKILPNMLLM